MDESAAGLKRGGRGADKTQSLAILSPFDEQEEWAKISEIMASFGSGLARESVFVTEIENEFQSRLGLHSDLTSPTSGEGSSVGEWLTGLGLVQYHNLFITNGFDDVEFLGNGLLEEQDLKEIGVLNDSHCEIILAAASKLQTKIKPSGNNNVKVPDNLEDWLKSIHLQKYTDVFKKNLYTDMDRILRIWEVELTAVLEITKLGHKKRILASLGGGSHGPNLEDLNADIKQLNSNIHELKEEIKEKYPHKQHSIDLNLTKDHEFTVRAQPITHSQTLPHRHHKKSRPPPPPVPVRASSLPAKEKNLDLSIREPSELVVGVPSALTTQWRHKPEVLVTQSISYSAHYLGSTLIKELKGTESTKKSIQKLQKSTTDETKDPNIVLSVSYKGVKFLNPVTQELVCEHEIRNIHCACQDADDLSHFAYITKDHHNKNHYCHVFCVQTMDQATEVILTLGQAFEVAYQMALKEHSFNLSDEAKMAGHTRSHSANQILKKGGTLPPSHARSQSANEIKVVNGHSDTTSSSSKLEEGSTKSNDSLSEKQEGVPVNGDPSPKSSKSSIVSDSLSETPRAPIATSEEI